MLRWLLLAIFFLGVAAAVEQPTYHLRVLVPGTKTGSRGCEVLAAAYGQGHRQLSNTAPVLMFRCVSQPELLNKLTTSSFSKPAAHSHDPGDEELEARFGVIVDFFGNEVSAVWDYAVSKLPCLNGTTHSLSPGLPLADDIQLLVDSGPPSNRIDIVFMVS